MPSGTLSQLLCSARPFWRLLLAAAQSDDEELGSTLRYLLTRVSPSTYLYLCLPEPFPICVIMVSRVTALPCSNKGVVQICFKKTHETSTLPTRYRKMTNGVLGSVSDPDSGVFWIRIRNPDPDPGA